MTRRRSDSNPVSLFPFLAVLLSAMGSLILLLVVVTRQAQRSRDLEYRSASQNEIAQLEPLPERKAFPKVDRPAPLELPVVTPPDLPPLPTVHDPRPELEEKKKGLEDELRRAQATPSDPSTEKARQSVLAELQAKLSELKDQLQKIEQAKAKAEQDRNWAEKTKRDLDARWSKAQANAEKAENRFSIVPYFGRNGSDREPIYIECQADRIILQPEGVEIKPLELGNPLSSENTLASAMRALLAHDRAAGLQPYPLLVVRPKGISTYYVARLALASVRVEYGYELVPQSVELDFGQKNEKKRDIAQSIVESARRKIPPGAMQRPTDWALDDGTGEGPGGGPEDDPLATSVSDLRHMRSPTREELERLARGLPSVNGPGTGERDEVSLPGEMEGEGEGWGNSNAARPDPRGGGLSEGPTGTLSDRRAGSSNMKGWAGRAEEGAAGRPGVADMGTGIGSRSHDPAGKGRLPGSRPNESEPAVLGGSAADRLNDLGVPKSLAASRQSAGLRRIAPGSARLGPPTSADVAASQRGNFDRDGAEGSSADGAASEPRGQDPQASGTASANGVRATGPRSPKRAGNNRSTSAARTNASATSAGDGAGSPPSPNEFQQALADASGGGSPSTMTMDGNMPIPSISKQWNAQNKKADDEEGPSGPPNGQPDFGPTGSIRETWRRTVVVECRDAGVTLYPDGTFIRFEPGEDLSEVRSKIYKHVAQQMVQWGPPGEVHRWAPVLEFAVRPDGLPRYYDLRFSMTSSGLEVRHRLLSWKDDVDFSETFGGTRPADQALRNAADTTRR